MDTEIVVSERKGPIGEDTVADKGKRELVEIRMEKSVLEINERLIRSVEGLVGSPSIIVAGRSERSLWPTLAVEHAVDAIFVGIIGMQIPNLGKVEGTELHEDICQLIEYLAESFFG
jgi:hypothetical protein